MSPETQPVKLSDLATLATAITLLRGVFAATAPLWPTQMLLPLYLAALLSDVLDGAIARRTHTTTRAGAMLDGWIDKILHVNLLWHLAILDWFPDSWLLAFWIREIIQAPLVPILTWRFRLGIGPEPKTNLFGRAAAISLAVATVAILTGQPVWLLMALTGVLGTLSGLTYIKDYILPWVRL